MLQSYNVSVVVLYSSIKYSGLLTTLLLLVLCGKDLWELLPSPSKTDVSAICVDETI